MTRVALALAVLLASAPAEATLAPDRLAEVATEAPTNARLPSNLPFVDQAGRAVRSGDEIGRAPTVLLFADYTCAHLCGPGLTLTAGALHDSGLKAERDYRLLVIGIDPKDGPADARAMRDMRLGALPDVRRAATMLSGSADAIRAATSAFGYRYQYDPATDQFAHDAAVFVLTPDGSLSAVLPETAASPAQVRASVEHAAAGEHNGGLIAQAIAVCYGFGAAHGVHGAAIRDLMRIAAVLTVLALSGGMVFLVRRRKMAR